MSFRRTFRQSLRPGRALVELLVAMVILTSGSTVVLALLQGTVVAADQLVQVGAARSLARDVAEQLVANPCGSGDGAVARGRLLGEWRTTRSSAAVVQQIDVVLPRAKGAAARPVPLHAAAAGWCR